MGCAGPETPQPPLRDGSSPGCVAECVFARVESSTLRYATARVGGFPSGTSRRNALVARLMTVCFDGVDRLTYSCRIATQCLSQRGIHASPRFWRQRSSIRPSGPRCQTAQPALDGTDGYAEIVGRPPNGMLAHPTRRPQQPGEDRHLPSRLDLLLLGRLAQATLRGRGSPSGPLGAGLGGTLARCRRVRHGHRAIPPVAVVQPHRCRVHLANGPCLPVEPEPAADADLKNCAVRHGPLESSGSRCLDRWVGRARPATSAARAA